MLHGRSLPLFPNSQYGARYLEVGDRVDIQFVCCCSVKLFSPLVIIAKAAGFNCISGIRKYNTYLYVKSVMLIFDTFLHVDIYCTVVESMQKHDVFCHLVELLCI